jgi:phage tail-like protein
MPVMNVKEEQTVPAIFFELKLQVMGRTIGYFTEVSGLSGEMETLSYNEGGRNDRVHRLPTRMKHPNLVLKRGVTNRAELELWFDKVAASPEQKTIQLTMYNEGLEKIRGWSFENAYPVKWTGPTFNVGQNQFATEAIEIAHAGIKVVQV